MTLNSPKRGEIALLGCLLALSLLSWSPKKAMIYRNFCTASLLNTIFFFFTFFQWEFDYIDKNKNNVLDNEEVGRIFFDLLNVEPCIEGFLLSCDQNEKEGIERREWDFCFPKTAGNI